MTEDATTKPTIETVLERINALGERMNEGFVAVGTRLDKMEGRLDLMDERLEQMDTRLDRTQAMVHEMRADFRDFRAQFKAPA
jgi:predicted  nucleic acid-binding Zn-ribbon protein